MPKKRHWARYTKPQTTAPRSLESHGLQNNLHHDEPQARNVNALLANLRKTQLASTATASSSNGGGSGGSGGGANDGAGLPSVPPEIAHILLQAPAGPGGPLFEQQHPTNGGGAGAGAGAGQGGGGGRGRAPAGPAPPPSWLAQSMHAPRRSAHANRWTEKRGQDNSRGGARRAARRGGIDMPGVWPPDRNSLVELTLRQMVQDWAVQKRYNKYYLAYLPGPFKAALVSYLSEGAGNDGGGVTMADLKALLLPPPVPLVNGDGEGEGDDDDDDGGEDDDLASPSTLNEDVRYLDVSLSVGQSVQIKELADLLFPGRPDGSSGLGSGLQEAWDAPEAMSLPRPLLPNLTHLSLAQGPGGGSRVSWRQLLSFATHLPTLTHLSLAWWPEPTLTPNAKYTTVVTPQGRRVQFGGTGPYSHSLDNDWAEAILVVRKLSKALYGLEYLDLTGCAAWFPALMKRADRDEVDWVGDWGKMTTLVMCCGARGDEEQDEEGERRQPGAGAVARQVNAASEAQLVERHIRRQRAGRGRFITVIGDRPIDGR